MLRKEAERFVADYSRLLKSWAIASVGFSSSSEIDLLRQLDDGLEVLTSIMEDFPDLRQRAEMLANARRSTVATPDDDL